MFKVVCIRQPIWTDGTASEITEGSFYHVVMVEKCFCGCGEDVYQLAECDADSRYAHVLFAKCDGPDETEIARSREDVLIKEMEKVGFMERPTEFDLEIAERNRKKICERLDLQYEKLTP